MGKHSAKRFDTKDSGNKKSFKLKYFLFLLILIGIVFFIIFRENFSFDFFKKYNPDKEIESTNSTSLSNLLSTEGKSKYEEKYIENTSLKLSNLFLKYEQNITVIEFEIYNESQKEQPIFDFIFSLLDEDNVEMISYNLSSEEVIPSKGKKKFILIASRDVSNAYDYDVKFKK